MSTFILSYFLQMLHLKGHKLSRTWRYTKLSIL